MRSSGRAPAAAWLAATAVVLAVSSLGAQSSPQTVKARFDAAAESDEKVRILLTNLTDATPAADVLKQVGQVTTAFESIVRRFPTSSYADNALWQAGSLADTAYQRFKRPDDRDRATKFYRWLAQEYPTSPLVKQANAKLAALSRSSSTPAPPIAAAAPPVLPAKPSGNASAPTNAPPATAAAAAPVVDPATLTAIQRQVLPDTVRVTLELDREVAYHEGRIDGPARLFFDLKNVQAAPALKDKVLSFNSDAVSKIRVGRHPDSTVRVVLDLEEVSKYSVFTLYNPFRLVIDAERKSATTMAATKPAVETKTPPAKAAATVATPPMTPLPSPALAPTPPVEVRRVAIAEPTLAPPTPEPAASIQIDPAPPQPPPPPPAAPASNATGGFSIARQLGLSVSRIVIDPGHGGHDPGTLAKGLNEADLTLDVALRLEKLLQKDPGVEVILTRRTDVFIPLEERTAIANRHSADLFLSIHANSSRNAEARGIETFFLSFASSPDAEAVAARENSASEREMHQLPDIIKAIALNNKLDESRDLANMVQNSLVTTLRKSNQETRSRGVKKAPFVVLIGAGMPSVLAEISFLTNRQELQLLKTAAYKDKIAKALYDAVVKYRRSLKGAAALTVER